MIAFWDDWNLLVLENDVLKLFSTGTTGASIEEKETVVVSVYPNPANTFVNVQLEEVPSNTQIVVQSIDGKEVIRETNVSKTQKIDISSLANGAYIIKLIAEEQEIYSDKLIIEK